MRIPITMIVIFCTTFLGTLSVIYDHILHERIDIVDEIGGVATRMVSQTHIFSQLEENDVIDKDAFALILDDPLEKQIADLNSTFTRIEMQAFTKVAYEAATREARCDNI